MVRLLLPILGLVGPWMFLLSGCSRSHLTGLSKAHRPSEATATGMRRFASGILESTQTEKKDGSESPEGPLSLADDQCVLEDDPGATVVRRLSGFEFENSVQDVFGTSVSVRAVLPQDLIPDDDFDNLSFAQSEDQASILKYIDAARLVADKVLAPENPTRTATLGCSPAGEQVDACVESALRRVLPKLYRRPIETADVEPLLALARRGGGLKSALMGALLSPHFLFRSEKVRTEGDQGNRQTLSDFELATRLAYFLWSSPPDAELYEAAARGDLATSQGIENQAKRMIANPKSAAFTQGFAAQWLKLRKLDPFEADAQMFPQFTAELKTDMKEETKAFFQDAFAKNRSAFHLVTAKESFVNERLGRHYGVQVTGTALKSVALPDLERGGLLGQASILTLTSHGATTNPMSRGKWVLDKLLCMPPPPPPDDAGGLPEQVSSQNLTKRQMFELHRQKPSCAACHMTLDPLGFGLENYDAVGRWRMDDHGLPLDTQGQLPDGRSFGTPSEMRSALVSDLAVPQCVLSHMTVYALGRRLSDNDKCRVAKTIKKLGPEKIGLADLAIAVVSDESFRMRRSSRAEPKE